jgi:hypothetical protein
LGPFDRDHPEPADAVLVQDRCDDVLAEPVNIVATERASGLARTGRRLDVIRASFGLCLKSLVHVRSEEAGHLTPFGHLAYLAHHCLIVAKER